MNWKQIVLLVVTICVGFLWWSTENDKTKAIELVKGTKVHSLGDSPLVNLFLGSSTIIERTWADYADEEIQKAPNSGYNWIAEKTGSQMFLVKFIDKQGWGQRWEVSNMQTVLHINGNEYLSRKYGLLSFDTKAPYKIDNIQEDTVKMTTMGIQYVLKADVYNSSDIELTAAGISGSLMLIFEDKTVEAKTVSWKGFERKVTESNPWLPNTKKTFSLRTNPKDVEKIYLNYDPEYVVFNVRLDVENPTGHSYDRNIVEFDAKRLFNKLKVKD